MLDEKDEFEGLVLNNDSEDLLFLTDEDLAEKRTMSPFFTPIKANTHVPTQGTTGGKPQLPLESHKKAASTVPGTTPPMVIRSSSSADRESEPEVHEGRPACITRPKNPY